MIQKDDNIDRTCKAKKAYRTAFFAFMMAQQLGRRKGRVFDYYRCRFCGKYHVGHV